MKMNFGYCRITNPEKIPKILQKLSQSNLEFQSFEFGVPIFTNISYWKILDYNSRGIYLDGYMGERKVKDREFFYFSEFQRGIVLYYTKQTKPNTLPIVNC